MLMLSALIQSWCVTSTKGWSDRRLRGDAGQTTAEYALILIAAAAVAVLLITWATKTDRIGKLFDLVVDQVTGRLK